MRVAIPTSLYDLIVVLANDAPQSRATACAVQQMLEGPGCAWREGEKPCEGVTVQMHQRLLSASASHGRSLGCRQFSREGFKPEYPEEGVELAVALVLEHQRGQEAVDRQS